MFNASGNVVKSFTINDFKMVTNLGCGSFADVMLAYEKKSKHVVALKAIPKSKLYIEQNRENLKREIQLQHRLQHPSIVGLHCFFVEKHSVYMVLEICDTETLADVIAAKKGLNITLAAYIIDSLADALQYCHERKVIHRDVKPSNIVFGDAWQPKLTDFGLSAQAIVNRDTYCGTIMYMAPEMLQSKDGGHNFMVDVWALGVIFFEAVDGCSPFEEPSFVELCKNITTANVRSTTKVPQWAIKLIKQLLRVDPSSRMKISGLRANRSFQQQVETFLQDGLPEER